MSSLSDHDTVLSILIIQIYYIGEINVAKLTMLSPHGSEAPHCAAIIVDFGTSVFYMVFVT